MLLGLPLSEALRLCEKNDWKLSVTRPQRGREEGDMRVVRVTPTELTVAPFLSSCQEDPVCHDTHAQVP